MVTLTNVAVRLVRLLGAGCDVSCGLKRINVVLLHPIAHVTDGTGCVSCTEADKGPNLQAC